jgi:hypothetical protein
VKARKPCIAHQLLLTVNLTQPIALHPLTTTHREREREGGREEEMGSLPHRRRDGGAQCPSAGVSRTPFAFYSQETRATRVSEMRREMREEKRDEMRNR